MFVITEASLEIEEEEESVKIKKYKSHYQERLQKRKEHKQSKIEHEEQLIRDKEKLLAVYRAKDKAKKDVKKRVVCYSIANQFLQGLYKDAALALFRRKAYVD